MKSTATSNRILHFGRMIAGLVFLFNPNVNMVDILPDVIGYLLLLWGVNGAAGIAPYFEDACRGFRRMVWVSLAKIPALFLVLSIIGTNAGERGLLTVFAFGFAALEIIFALPALRDLLRAFTHLGEMEGIAAALRTREDGRGVADSLHLLTILFVVARGALSFLPELSFISVFDSLTAPGVTAVHPAMFYPYYAIAAFVFGLVIGIIWLTAAVRYYKGLSTDATMQDYLERTSLARADEIRDRAQQRHISSALFFFTLGLVFSVDLIVDNVNYLPDALSAVCFLSAAILLCRVTEQRLLAPLFVGIGYLASTVVSPLLSDRFFSEHILADIPYNDKAKELYTAVEIATVVETALLLALLAVFFLLFRALIRGFVGIRSLSGRGGLQSALQRELTRRTLSTMLIGGFVALFHLVETFLLTLTTKYVIPPEEANEHFAAGDVVYMQVFGGSWLLTLAFSLLFLGFGAYFIYTLKGELFFDQDEG